MIHMFNHLSACGPEEDFTISLSLVGLCHSHEPETWVLGVVMAMSNTTYSLRTLLSSLHFLVILNFGSSQCWQINFPKSLLSLVLLFFPVFASFCFLTWLCSCISLLLNACFLCITFFMSLVLCSLHFPWTHYVAEAGCEFLIFLHLPPDYGDYRCVPLVLVVKFKFLLSLNFFMILHAYFLLWTFLSPSSLKSL